MLVDPEDECRNCPIPSETGGEDNKVNNVKILSTDFMEKAKEHWHFWNKRRPDIIKAVWESHEALRFKLDEVTKELSLLRDKHEN
jgi:hypothetical protein